MLGQHLTEPVGCGLDLICTRSGNQHSLPVESVLVGARRTDREPEIYNPGPHIIITPSRSS